MAEKEMFVLLDPATQEILWATVPCGKSWNLHTGIITPLYKIDDETAWTKEKALEYMREKGKTKMLLVPCIQITIEREEQK